MTQAPCGIRPRSLPWHDVLIRFGSIGGILLILASRGAAGEPRKGAPTPLVRDVPDDAETKPALANDMAGEQRPGTTAGPADQEQEVRRAFNTGIVMLGGILICGVGLIAVVLLWGNRVRRIARQALPKIAPRDELWYLKHKIESGAIRPRDHNGSEPPADPKG